MVKNYKETDEDKFEINDGKVISILEKNNQVKKIVKERSCC